MPAPPARMTKTLAAALAYFALVFGAGFVLGVLRVALLVPRVGERTAELLEMPVMLVVIVLAARLVVRRFALPPQVPTRLAVGRMALMLLVAAEIALGALLQQRSPVDVIFDRDPVSGAVYLLMLVVFAAMPLMATPTPRQLR